MNMPPVAVPPAPRALSDRLVLLVATGLGTGYLKPAPGTWGSLMGFPLAIGLSYLPWPWRVACAFLLLPVGTILCDRAARLLQRKDPRQVVFDEILAFPFIYATLPLTWTTAIVGFVLFRVLDAVKPWPVGQAEQLPGGWGILMDDILAGAITGLILRMAFVWFVT